MLRPVAATRLLLPRTGASKVPQQGKRVDRLGRSRLAECGLRLRGLGKVLFGPSDGLENQVPPAEARGLEAMVSVRPQLPDRRSSAPPPYRARGAGLQHSLRPKQGAREDQGPRS